MRSPSSSQAVNVLGVDGSNLSEDALRWSGGQAQLVRSVIAHDHGD